MAVMRARGLSDPGTPVAAPLAAHGESQKPIVRPEAGYFVFLVGVLVIGAVVALALDDGRRTWQAPAQISAFAVIFVMTQAIERVLEIFAPFFGTTATTNKPAGAAQSMASRMTKSQALRVRDEALATAASGGDSAKLKEAAWGQELVDQIRANTSTLWAVGAALGMIAAGQMGILLLALLQVPDIADQRWLDIVVTGFVIGGGTKALHELIKNVQAGKEKNQDAATK